MPKVLDLNFRNIFDSPALRRGPLLPNKHLTHPEYTRLTPQNIIPPHHIEGVDPAAISKTTETIQGINRSLGAVQSCAVMAKEINAAIETGSDPLNLSPEKVANQIIEESYDSAENIFPEAKEAIRNLRSDPLSRATKIALILGVSAGIILFSPSVALAGGLASAAITFAVSHLGFTAFSIAAAGTLLHYIIPGGPPGRMRSHIPLVRDLNFPKAKAAALVGGIGLGATLGLYSIFGLTPFLLFGGALLVGYKASQARKADPEPRFVREFPWLNPEYWPDRDRNIPQETKVKIATYFKEFSDALTAAAEGLGKGIPKRILREIAALSDPTKVKNVRQVYIALCFMAGYMSLRGFGSYEVTQLPGLSTVMNKFFNIAGTILLGLGEAPSRWTTSIGYLDLILKGMERSGEYYAPERPTDPTCAAGFDPRDKDGLTFLPVNRANPEEKSTVRYFAFEAGLPDPACEDMTRRALAKPGLIDPPDYSTLGMMGRSVWSTFLIENRLQRQIVGAGGAPFRDAEAIPLAEYQTIFDSILNWIERNRREVETAFKAYREKPGNPTTEVSRLLTVLSNIRNRYHTQEKIWHDLACEKFNRGLPNGAVDDYLADMWKGHVKQLDEKIRLVNEWMRQFQDREINAPQLAANLERMYGYLEHRFTHDIFYHTNYWYHRIDISASSLYTRIFSLLSTNLATIMQLPLTTDRAATILTALGTEMAAADRPQAINVNALRDRAINENWTCQEFLQKTLFELLTQPLFVGVSKAGLESGIYGRYGHTMVSFHSIPVNNLLELFRQKGKLMEMTKEQWLAFSRTWLFPNEREQLSQLETQLTPTLGTALIPPLDRTTAQEIIDGVIHATGLDTRAANPDDVCARRRIRTLERLRNNFVMDNNTPQELLQEALIVAISSREVEWMDWPDPNYVGIMDKDYVYLSILSATSEFEDIFRIALPMLLKWQAQGRLNLSSVQLIQKYAFYQKTGPVARPEDIAAGRETIEVEGKTHLVFPRDVEPTAKDCDADQQTWYGLLIFAFEQRFRKGLDKSVGKMSGNDFLAQELRPLSQLYAAMYDGQNISNVLQDVRTEMGARIDGPLTYELGIEIIERVKTHMGRAVYGVGILPGRAYDNSFFCCGPCRIVNVLAFVSGLRKPYIADRTGKVKAQLDIIYNPATKRTEMSDYTPRFLIERGTSTHMVDQVCETYKIGEQDRREIEAYHANLDERVEIIDNKVTVYNSQSQNPTKVYWWYLPPDTEVLLNTKVKSNDADTFATAKYIEKRLDLVLGDVENKGMRKTGADFLKDISARMGDFYTVMADGRSKAQFEDAVRNRAAAAQINLTGDLTRSMGKKLIKIILAEAARASNPENGAPGCGLVEICFENGRVSVIKDHQPVAGRTEKPFLDNCGSIIETRLREGRTKEVSFVVENSEVEEALETFQNIVELEAPPLQTPLGNNRTRLDARVCLAIAESIYIPPSGKRFYAEQLHPLQTFMPDKWITEDMASTYYGLSKGWRLEAMPVEVGRGESPVGFADLAGQHYRWAKGGIEVFRDFFLFVLKHPSFMFSKEGWHMLNAFLWYPHGAFDTFLYLLPAAFWIGTFAQMGFVPLVTGTIYPLIFLGYLTGTILSYGVSMKKLGNTVADIVNKEAVIKCMGPVYAQAFLDALAHIPIFFVVTESSTGRKTAPYDVLRGIAWRQTLSLATVTFGTTFMTIMGFGYLGLAAGSQDYCGWLFNTGFPFLNYWLLNRGVNRNYGFSERPWDALNGLPGSSLTELGNNKYDLTFSVPAKQKLQSNLDIINSLKSIGIQSSNIRTDDDGNRIVNMRLKIESPDGEGCVGLSGHRYYWGDLWAQNTSLKPRIWERPEAFLRSLGGTIETPDPAKPTEKKVTFNVRKMKKAQKKLNAVYTLRSTQISKIGIQHLANGREEVSLNIQLPQTGRTRVMGWDNYFNSLSHLGYYTTSRYFLWDIGRGMWSGTKTVVGGTVKAALGGAVMCVGAIAIGLPFTILNGLTALTSFLVSEGRKDRPVSKHRP